MLLNKVYMMRPIRALFWTYMDASHPCNSGLPGEGTGRPTTRQKNKSQPSRLQNDAAWRCTATGMVLLQKVTEWFHNMIRRE